jgi:Domain of unknown function (DUF4397)
VPPVDLLIDDAPAVSDLGFAAASPYIELPPGEHTLRVVASDDGAEVLATSVTLAAGQYYSVAAIGLNELAAQTYNDDRSPLAAGQARVRVIHTSPDAPGVDVEVVGGQALAQDVSFGEASPYQSLPAGSYDLQVVATGNNVVFLPLPGVELRAGLVYDVYAVGRLANLQTLVLTAPALTTGAPQQMPVTAAGSVAPGGLGLALGGVLLIAAGLGLRRRAAPAPGEPGGRR